MKRRKRKEATKNAFYQKNNKPKTNNSKNKNLKTQTKTNNIQKKTTNAAKPKSIPKVSNSNHLIIEQIQKLLKEIK